MSRRYAEDTKVPVERSMESIRKIAEKAGAGDYFTGRRNGEEFVAFTLAGFPIVLKAPPLPAKLRSSVEQERRRQWRVLELWVKGQIEAMRGGILEPGEAFLPFLQLADGRCLGEHVREGGMRAINNTLALPAAEGEA